jgi:teichuronic acid exporter
MSLKKDTVWAATDAFTGQGLNFAFRLILAQQLGPKEFGILSMAATTLLVIGALNDFGLSATLVQRKKNELSESLISTAFTAAVLISVGLFVCNQLLVAPLSAAFFRTPDVSSIVMLLGCAFLLQPFMTVSSALLMRQRNFQAMTKCRVVAQILSMGLGAFVLFTYKTLWAAPIQVVSGQVFTTLFMFLALPWSPRFCWDTQMRRELFGFSSLVFLNNLLVSLSKNIGQIVIGRTLGASELGIYSLAFSLTDTVRTAVMSIMNRVMFVHYAEHQENFSRLSGDYLRTLAWNCSIVFPLMVAVATVGPSILPMILGGGWQGMDPVLSILAAAVAVHAAGGSTSSLLTAIGKPGLDLRLFAFTTLGIMFPAIIAGGLWLGAAGVAGGVLLSKIVSIVVRQIYMTKLIGLTWRHYLIVPAREAAKVAPLVVVLSCFEAISGSLHPTVYGLIVCCALLPYAAIFIHKFIRQ